MLSYNAGQESCATVRESRAVLEVGRYGQYGRETWERGREGGKRTAKAPYRHFLFPLRALSESQLAHRNTATMAGQANPSAG